ncbi:N-alpha-acetyltransferase 40 [Hyphodiscus hymeniophilus]|uniref:N-alpha-acetyltransferase 40 n=1 Tax=Hyphodiscus hymeniophilus TaxID=353542 RepID=A0A9P6VE09_9HELO|nr:N-alpha-acetyltransferase 40 [Hyphodiscus hymeniophilus]
MDRVNKKTLDIFVADYLPPHADWKSWTHPKTGEVYEVTLSTSTAVSAADFESCFRLIEDTSAEDYKKSSDGWKPRAKKKEMQLLDLKYFLVKHNQKVEGFVSFMPTYEDDYPVIYCYEIHLSSSLQSTGLGSILIGHLEAIGVNIPETEKTMLTCFTSNAQAVRFYEKLGYVKDPYSPPPKQLRNGTKVEAAYVILSKPIER